jgi:S1-C subfamily serine protease
LPRPELLSCERTVLQISRSGAKPRRPQAERPLTAEDVASKYLPAVLVITCDDSKGNTIQASGFFLSRGLIVTNYHVIEGMVRGQVKLPPFHGRKITALPISWILAFDRMSDLALLFVNVRSTGESDVTLSREVAELVSISKQASESARAAPIVNSSDDPLGINEFLERESIPSLASPNEPLRIGERIYALGNPLGLEGSISEGIISNVRQYGGSRLLQITTPVSPGSSGGPVINKRGHVVGVVRGTLSQGQNVNFAVASEHISKLIPRSMSEEYRFASSVPGAWKIPYGLPSP